VEEMCKRFYTGEIENFTKNRHLIIFIADLIVQRSIMKKSPKKIKKPTHKQIEKMNLKDIIQILEKVDKNRRSNCEK